MLALGTDWMDDAEPDSGFSGKVDKKRWHLESIVKKELKKPVDGLDGGKGNGKKIEVKNCS